ncbi:MAG: flagellar FliJ family protein, partial [Thermomicrobium sp.]|nr:flagellar FliJ family protein [Thermomicrobium sp.]
VSLALHAGRPVEATVLSGAEAYQAWLDRRREEQEAALEHAKRRAEAARAALVAQRREAKKLELVQARWLDEARRAELTADAKLLDEIANGQAARRALGSE